MNLRVLFLNFICINMNLLFLGFESSALFLNLKDVNFVLCEGDVVIVEDDDKNAAGKGRNLQVLRDIGNVVRRNHTKNNDPAKRALMCTTRRTTTLQREESPIWTETLKHHTVDMVVRVYVFT